MAGNYSAAIWRGYGQERPRWGVYCAASACFYFPRRYGRAAAESMARAMNARAANPIPA